MRGSYILKRCFLSLLFAALILGANESYGLSESGITISAKDKIEKSDHDGETEVETDDKLEVTSFRTDTEICTLNVHLGNRGEQERRGELQWCFISDHSTGETYDESPVKPVPATFSPGKKELTLAPDAVLNEKVVSAPFVFERKEIEVEEYTGDGNTWEVETETGDVYKGYILLFVENGEILAQVGSSSKYLKDEWLERCRKAISAGK